MSLSDRVRVSGVVVQSGLMSDEDQSRRKALEKDRVARGKVKVKNKARRPRKDSFPARLHRVPIDARKYRTIILCTALQSI